VRNEEGALLDLIWVF